MITESQWTNRLSLSPHTNMRKVIDVSAFESEQLESFLRASPANRAVLTDYAGLETFQRNGPQYIQRAFSMLKAYDNQVVVLNPTAHNSRLRPKRKGIESRLIDERSTKGFRTFVQHLEELISSRDSRALEQLEAKRRKAVAQMDRLLADVTKLNHPRDGILAIGLNYPPELLDAIRARRPLPPDFHETAASHVLQITRATMDKLFPGVKLAVEDVFYSFPFRFNLAMYSMNFFWTATGDVTTAPAKKVRNDATDMTYVAYATFFDGIITDDSKLAAAYNLTKGFLRTVFRVE